MGCHTAAVLTGPLAGSLGGVLLLGVAVIASASAPVGTVQPNLGDAGPGVTVTAPATPTPVTPVVPAPPVSPEGGPTPGSDDDAVLTPAGLSTGEAVTASARSRKRLAVGDSLLVAARHQLRRRGFTVRAKVGRQFSAAPAILRGYGSKLARNVVIELGTNGTVSLATCKKVVRIAGKHRRVFLVNNRVPRSWQNSNNRTLRRCDRSFPGRRVRVIDWHEASAGHRSWFAADGVHHTARGRRAFVRVIDRAVDKHGL